MALHFNTLTLDGATYADVTLAVDAISVFYQEDAAVCEFHLARQAMVATPTKADPGLTTEAWPILPNAKFSFAPGGDIDIRAQCYAAAKADPRFAAAEDA